MLKELRDLEPIVATIRPALVVIDSLRAFRPDAAKSNDIAGALLNWFRHMSRTYSTLFLLIHHLRKPPARRDTNEIQVVAGLDETPVSEWMLDMEGARALVNQSDVRIGVEAVTAGKAALVMKWSRRLLGDSPAMQLERVYDDAGEPLGYRHLTGRDYLKPEQSVALTRLPSVFTFADAMIALGRTQPQANKFLKIALSLGLIAKLGRGQYRKL